MRNVFSAINNFYFLTEAFEKVTRARSKCCPFLVYYIPVSRYNFIPCTLPRTRSTNSCSSRTTRVHDNNYDCTQFPHLDGSYLKNYTAIALRKPWAIRVEYTAPVRPTEEACCPQCTAIAQHRGRGRIIKYIHIVMIIIM